MIINDIDYNKFISLIPKFDESKNNLKEITNEIFKILEEDIINLKNKKIGILFSGGIDSSILCYLLKKNKINFQAIGIGFYDEKIEGLKYPPDIEYGIKISKKIKINYNFKIYTFKEIENEFKKTVNLIGIDYPQVSVNIGVGTIERLGIIELKKKGCNHIISGLGSEELFAGYHRHTKGNVLKKTEEGLREMFNRDIQRLIKLSEYYDVEINLPFLNKRLIEFSSKINSELKIKNNFEKYCLRKTFENKLPNEVVWRKKKAAQYGSRLDSAIEKLKNKYEFKEKKDYLINLSIK